MRPLSRLLPVPARRDPAPSLLAYRLSRLWLSPRFRLVVLYLLPTVLALLLLWSLATRPGVAESVEEGWTALRDRFRERPEFLLSGLVVHGGSDELRAGVAEVVGLAFPVSSLAIDLPGIRARVEALSAVASAQVSVGEGNRLVVRLVERVPVAILRRGAELRLVDPEGHAVARIEARAVRPDLPLLIGEGAERAVPEALALLAAAAPVAPRIRALVRVGERRWDLVLDRDQRILLPEAEPLAALERVMALDRAEKLLARDAFRIDLRDGARPVLRLGPDALEALRIGTKPGKGQET